MGCLVRLIPITNKNDNPWSAVSTGVIRNLTEPAAATGSQVEKGATAAVFGLGTIGLAVIDALREVGASRIIGVDMDEGKFARAKEWGATDLLNPKKYDKSIVVCGTK